MSTPRYLILLPSSKSIVSPSITRATVPSSYSKPWKIPPNLFIDLGLSGLSLKMPGPGGIGLLGGTGFDGGTSDFFESCSFFVTLFFSRSFKLN